MQISATEASPAAETSNVTKPTLTGNPQIDWAWDPNLPQELNGKNLSDYPFYERVPEDIDFKCDGLHDGFYASVPHKCQVYCWVSRDKNGVTLRVLFDYNSLSLGF